MKYELLGIVWTLDIQGRKEPKPVYIVADKRGNVREYKEYDLPERYARQFRRRAA